MINARALTSTTDMNATTQLVPLSKQSIDSYAKAARRLRRETGSKAPTAVELINFELAGRNPRDIASAFLDHLRDLERRRRLNRGVERPRRDPGSSNVALTRPDTWPGRRASVGMSDPTRN